LGAWISFRLSAKLGAFDPGIGKAGNVDHGVRKLAVTLPDGKFHAFDGLKVPNPEFVALNQVMFISTATEKTAFYLDSLSIKNE